MRVAAKLDELGKPAWIALAVLTFIVWWPIGLATLAYMYGSGRMGCVKGGRFGRWYNVNAREGDERQGRWFGGRGGGGGGRGPKNSAFEDYRADTLRRLEEEEREFRSFLERLRFARDKAEFDEFMADRRRRAEAGESNAAAG